MHKIHFGPLQGFTNYTYRKLHQKYFGGVDKYYSPYLRFEKGKEFKKSSIKDLQPENNEGINFVPQVLGNDVDIFADVLKQIEDWGYKEVNWNLGCPYPMVTKRGFGSCLVSKPEDVKSILDTILPKTRLKLSVKCRLGLVDENEIYELIDVLNQFDIEELTVHTRIAKQLYKGNAKPELFIPLIEKSNHKLIYNGDIIKTSDIESLDSIFGNNQDEYMIGRGLLMNPFLASEIKGKVRSADDKKKTLKMFHSDLFHSYEQHLQSSHLLNTMRSQWEYLSFMFENQHKAYKIIKKAKSINHYNDAIAEVFSTKIL